MTSTEREESVMKDIMAMLDTIKAVKGELYSALLTDWMNLISYLDLMDRELTKYSGTAILLALEAGQYGTPVPATDEEKVKLVEKVLKNELKMLNGAKTRMMPMINAAMKRSIVLMYLSQKGITVDDLSNKEATRREVDDVCSTEFEGFRANINSLLDKQAQYRASILVFRAGEQNEGEKE
jgi:hypothetical protein